MREQNFQEVSHQITSRYIRDLAIQAFNVIEYANIEPSEFCTDDDQDNKTEYPEEAPPNLPS